MYNFTFENWWSKDKTEILPSVRQIWRDFGRLPEDEINKRIDQLLFIAKDEQNEVVAISTAYRIYFKQLRNYFYAFRCMVVPGCRVPGLDAKITVESCKFLEVVHEQEKQNKPIGVLTLVENSGIKERTYAVWPASKMAFIGTTPEGHHLRVFYFKDARILC